MPLAAFSMDPVTAAHLRAIGLPNGPNRAPDAATTSMGLNAALNASPLTNGTQTPPVTPQSSQQASQQDTSAIYAADPMGNMGGQGGAAPAPTPAARLQAAQAAMQPTASQPAPMQDPQANADPMGSMGGQGGTATSPGTGAAVSGLAGSMFPSATAAQRLAAAQAASPPATPPQQPAAAPQAPVAPPGAPPQGAPLQPGGPPIARDADGLPTGTAAAAPGGPSGAPQASPATTLPQTPQAPPPPAPAPATPPASSPATPASPPGLTPQATAGKYSPAQIYAALVKQGVPENDAATLTAVSGAESGYGAHPVSGKNTNGTTDYGLFQINSSHSDLNPSSLVNADLDTQAAAAASVYKKEGLGAWTTYKSGAYQKFAGDVQGAAATGGNLGGPNSPPGTYSAVDAIHQGSAIGIDPKAMMDLATSLGYKPIDTAAFNNRNLIAMGMAMMGGRTFADSMKNGAGVMNDSNNAMLGVQEKQNSNALQMAQVGINAKRADAQMALESQRVAAMDRERPIGTSTTPDGKTITTMYNPVTQGTRTVESGGMNAGAQTAFRKENEKDVDAIENEGKAASSHIQETNDLMTMLNDPATHAGPGLVQAIQRHVAAVSGDVAANIGLPNTATNDQIAERLSKMTQSEAAQAMRGTGLRNALEFKTFTGQAVDLNTTPEAAKAVLQPSLTRAQQAYQAYNDWVNLGLTGQNALRNQQGAVGAFKQKYDQRAANQLVAGSGGGQAGMTKGTGDAVAAAKQTANGGLQGTTPNGVSFTLHP